MKCSFLEGAAPMLAFKFRTPARLKDWSVFYNSASPSNFRRHFLGVSHGHEHNRSQGIQVRPRPLRKLKVDAGTLAGAAGKTPLNSTWRIPMRTVVGRVKFEFKLQSPNAFQIGASIREASAGHLGNCVACLRRYRSTSSKSSGIDIFRAVALPEILTQRFLRAKKNPGPTGSCREPSLLFGAH
jgi:hypothetical protein